VARVIKGSGGGQPRAAPQRAAGKRRVLEKEVYRAKQEAEQIKKDAATEVEGILHEGKRAAAQQREEAQADGAAEAFAHAAAEALTAFRSRAERYGEAADDIRVLALEVVHKVVGHTTKLPADKIDTILEEGMDLLRARRKLRLQLPEDRLTALQQERPALITALHREPDLLLESADDVSQGYCRVVTEMGGALCAEQTALDTLAEALEVDEQAVAPAPHSARNDVADAIADDDADEDANEDDEYEYVDEDEVEDDEYEYVDASEDDDDDGEDDNDDDDGVPDSTQVLAHRPTKLRPGRERDPVQAGARARARALGASGLDTGPEETEALVGGDLRADLDKRRPSDDEDDEDDLDLFADDSLPGS